MHFFDKLVNIVNSTNYSLILVFLLAVFMLPGGGSVVIPVLLLGTIVLLNGKRLEYLNKSEILFLSSFLLYFGIQLVYLIIFNGELRELDTPSRFLLVLPIFLYIRSYLKIGESFFIAIFYTAPRFIHFSEIILIKGKYIRVYLPLDFFLGQQQ